MTPVDHPTELQFMQQRCGVLDAFAELEAEVVSLLEKYGDGKGCSTRPLSQKLQSLGALKPNPQFSKQRKAEISAITAEIEPLLQVRADIVHSKMRFVVFDGESQGIFRNSADTQSSYPVVRVLTHGQLQNLSQSVRCLTLKLRAKP